MKLPVPLSCASLSLVALSAGPLQEPQLPEPLPDPARVQAELEKSGLALDLDAGLCAFEAEIAVRNELLEYLLVASFGAAHESLFATEMDAQLLNAALLLLGVQPGKNATWVLKDPVPSQEELTQGVSAYEVVLPEGDALYLYAAWREGEEEHFFRVEDLIRDLSRGRTMRRHKFVYLGSRMIPRGIKGDIVFAAGAEGNFVNLAYFSAGNTLLTAALEECVEQTIWLPNAWLLPERGSAVLLVFSRSKLEVLPPGLRRRLPVLPAASLAPTGGER